MAKSIQTKYRMALAAVTARLQEYAPQGFTAVIYDYLHGETRTVSKRPFVGVRVAEVSFHNTRSGSSYMQVDIPHGLLACALVERCILAEVEEWDQEEKDEEYCRLSIFLKGDASDVDPT